ncbi:hypothetical protein [Mycobacterium parmense]|uniref:Uncharacterized protein n=1 Tax=Mycobacterium parmense TaxID=185642 RepID=A0A7I7YT92_9MYCO|nr:hypothetical protein [Mycobacterium parmense]MCV7348695.1 hypothetical protein [Mycobacterium parmense]ORW52128.1 hypothetical protein AWC20_22020 [Mycobacterium parmense]BBZ44203.1 hypothetical protein MPRM_14840 [Mycobacterium parmense]
MRVEQLVVAGAATALAVALAGCGGKTATPSSSSASVSSSASSTTAAGAAPNSPAAGQPGDYANLLIQASDIEAPETFTASPPTSNPNGQPGVATTFSTQDGGHVIKDTIAVYADPGAAASALQAAKGAQGGAVKDPTTQPLNVGTGGTTLLGNSPDNSKGVTILLFTEGKALVTLEFDGPRDSLAPPDFVTDVGQKQDAAVKKGLGG